MNIEPIFTDFLATEMTDINNDPIVAHVLEQEKRYPVDTNSWQSPHGAEDINSPVWQKLIDHISYKLPFFSEIYGLSNQAQPKISDLWANITRRGDPKIYSAEPHIHANHWISFVYYAQANENSGSLILNSSNPTIEFALPANLVSDNTMYSSHRMTVRPQTGLLVAFPSWIQHWVDPNSSDEPRISVAINITLSHINRR